MDRNVNPKKPLPRQGYRMDRNVNPKKPLPRQGFRMDRINIRNVPIANAK